MSDTSTTTKIPKSINSSEITDYIRWFFNGYILSFVSIILSGKLLTQIPAFRINLVRGRCIIRFFTYLIDMSACGDEVIVGIGSFISVLFLTALLGGIKVQIILLECFGIEVPQFESLCIFSSFLLLIISFVLNLLYSSFSKNVGNYPPEYKDQIDTLSKEIQDFDDEQ